MADTREELEIALRAQLAQQGFASVTADAVAEALCARCREEVRVWAENFARSAGAQANELTEKDPAQEYFTFRK